jgi:pilus assembly protein CpaB
MKTRAIWVLALAIVCGASAAVGMSRLRQPGANATVETASVLVAQRDIPRGVMLTAEMVESKQWPQSMLPRKAVQRVDDIVGRAAAVPIVAGDLVTEGKLSSKDAGRGVAALIPSGMRAYTIQTSKAASNVAGFVLPGNRVDVLLTLHSYQNDGTGGGSTTTLLQAVEILAVDQRLDAPAENKVDPKDLQSVTLLVSPRQASLLDLGQNLGQLTLSLRNLEDKAEVPSTPATLAMLRFHEEGVAKSGVEGALQSLGVSAPKPPQAPRAPRRTTSIHTLRGTMPGEIRLTE